MDAQKATEGVISEPVPMAVTLQEVVVLMEAETAEADLATSVSMDWAAAMVPTPRLRPSSRGALTSAKHVVDTMAQAKSDKHARKSAEAALGCERKLAAGASREEVFGLADSNRASFRFHAGEDVPKPRNDVVDCKDAFVTLEELYKSSLSQAPRHNVLGSREPQHSRWSV